MRIKSIIVNCATLTPIDRHCETFAKQKTKQSLFAILESIRDCFVSLRETRNDERESVIARREQSEQRSNLKKRLPRSWLAPLARNDGVGRIHKWIATPFATLTARNDGVGRILNREIATPRFAWLAMMEASPTQLNVDLYNLNFSTRGLILCNTTLRSAQKQVAQK